MFYVDSYSLLWTGQDDARKSMYARRMVLHFSVVIIRVLPQYRTCMHL
jgi:hypothetical protein